MSREKSLNECPDLGPQKPFKLDDPSKQCDSDCTSEPSLKDVNFFDSPINNKEGIGADGNCDPVQYGRIINDISREPSRDTIYRYSKGIRGCDEAVVDMFQEMVVIDEQGVAHPVPTIWATQERAVAAVVQENYRKDTSLVVDRVRLPMISIYSTGFTYNLGRHTYHRAVNHSRKSDGKPGATYSEKYTSDTVFGIARGIPIDISYTMTIWTYFVEDMNQILEQILLKFSPIAYIRVQGVQWETILKLDSIASNVDTEPGNATNRVVKFQISMTAETYVPQPISRNKAVLRTRIDITDGLTDDDITDIITRLEDAVDELKSD